MKKTFFLLIILLNLTSCIIAPWKEQLYEHKPTAKIVLLSTFPDYDKFKDYYVNDSFIDVGIIAHDQMYHQSSPPYKIYINALGEFNNHIKFIIHDIKIESNKEKTYIIYNESFFPQEEDFEFISYTNQKSKLELAQVLYSLNKEFFFDCKNKEVITLTIDISIVTVVKSERRQIKYIFDPIIKRGLLQWIAF